MSPAPTYIACLTPAGRGAIATLAVRGPDAWRLVREQFSPTLPAVLEAGSIRLGRLGVAAAQDTVVLSVRASEPVPWLELHCHGGPEVIRLLTELFTERGVHACSWQEFVRLTAEEHSRAEARILLAHAPTIRTAGILLDQANGALARAVDGVRQALHAREALEAKARLDAILRYAPVGHHLIEPWHIVVAGAANVGKSSLVNALAGYERSIVSALPGTTRDVVTTRLAIDGWPVEVADTAGLRVPGEALEEEGIARARSALTEADLCLWVLDASVAPAFPPTSLGHTRLVINKIDLPSAWERDSVSAAVGVSALTGAGIPELCRAISEALVPEPPTAGAAVPFAAARVDRLQQAAVACARQDIAAARVLLDAPEPSA